jgi:hypothetical protein
MSHIFICSLKTSIKNGDSKLFFSCNKTSGKKIHSNKKKIVSSSLGTTQSVTKEQEETNSKFSFFFSFLPYSLPLPLPLNIQQPIPPCPSLPPSIPVSLSLTFSCTFASTRAQAQSTFCSLLKGAHTSMQIQAWFLSLSLSLFSPCKRTKYTLHCERKKKYPENWNTKNWRLTLGVV